jgi:hypothetical protein
VTIVNALQRLASALVGVLVLLAIFAAPAFAWPDVEEPATGAQAYADVELDIFSGRPNPHWTISADQIAPLLPEVDAPQLATSGEPPGLGYRGFLLTDVSTETGTPTVYRVFAGTVSIGTGNEQNTVVDAKGLEQWLLEDARQRGYRDLLMDVSVTPLSGTAVGGQ